MCGLALPQTLINPSATLAGETSAVSPISLPNSPPISLAVAVSGGGDSMALLHMLATAHPNVMFHALTVDHRLRPNSTAEAQSLTPHLTAHPNVKHLILTWDGLKPETGLMQHARTARYALMAQYCRDNNLTHLALAHHGDDQRETFLMRLARASGLDGLAAIRPLTPYDDSLTLWRPLLPKSHDELLEYCRTHNVFWVEDPSNHNENFERPRLRKLGPALEAEGLTANAISRTAARLARASDALEALTTQLSEQALIPPHNAPSTKCASTKNPTTDDKRVFNLDILRAAPTELIIRLLRRTLNELGNTTPYGARYDKVEELGEIIKNSNVRHKATLNGCIVTLSVSQKTLQITRENAA